MYFEHVFFSNCKSFVSNIPNIYFIVFKDKMLNNTLLKMNIAIEDEIINE